ncbi:putative CRISPR-associated protein [Sphaerospermopsis aphanizomenoides BCCUSP55]|uniref:putative CRISPR-associated protein n=1 Tax=Sphaerospermopsis aphanizomenoides TaxID=459663 RepID=UPI0019032D8B|nr:putative CRISPR-associated protein [Sphaerospermopsis aphanizomenoides]MBK1986922.1 putative CRISPR-associated protein [Sphaerospermopsis aphanizomenoides BCCUSP55]
MRNTLICTVGTSLFGNIRNSEESIKKAFEDKNWNQLALLLIEQENTARVCGAEINSITSICSKNLLTSRIRLIFLVSDTEEGKNTGQVLKLYYSNKKNSLKFDEVDYRILEGLRDNDVKAFKQQGLKNLVKEISTEVRKFTPETIAINATGGYKAQISFAGMIGQALEIPVYYLFEKFSEVIELPPQPVALDLAFWLNNYLLFAQLEDEQIIEESKLEGNLDSEYLYSLIDKETEGETNVVSLSAMGVLFNERSRLQFAKQENTILSLIPQDDTEPSRKIINLRDDHGKDIIQAFSERVCQSPYVKKVINSLPFNPKRSNPIRRTTDNGIVEFVLTWTDTGLGICIETTGRNKAETNTIAIYLQKKFAENN